MKPEKKGKKDFPRSRKTENVADILPHFVMSLEQKKKYKFHLLIHGWEKIVGRSISLHVRPVRLEFRKLFLAADAPVWASELRYMERKMIDKINAFVCEELVTEIVYCAPGSRAFIPAGEKEQEKDEAPIVPLSEEYDKTDGFLSGVEDEKLRTAAKKALAQSFALRRTLREEKWHACASCQRLVPPGQQLCPFCEREKKEKERRTIRELLKKEPWLHGYEICRILECTLEEAARERSVLLRSMVSRLRKDDKDSEEVKRLVMLFASVRPENLTPECMDKYLKRLRFDFLPDIKPWEQKNRKVKRGEA